MKEAERILKFIKTCFEKLPDYPWYYYVIGIIIFIFLVCIFYKCQNEKFIKKNGYPIINWIETGFLYAHGAFLYVGVTWREYAIENAKKVLYANILIGYSWFAIIFMGISLSVLYYKTKRKLGWLNILLAIFLTYILYAFTGMLVGIVIFLVIFSIFGNINWKPSRNYNDQGEEFKHMGIAKNIPGPNIENKKHY